MNAPAPPQPTPGALAYGALALAAALWGSNTVASKVVVENVPPFTVATARWIVVVLLLLPLVWRERARILEEWRLRGRIYVGFALVGFAPQNLIIYLGLAGSTATNLSLLNSSIPVLILLIGWVLHARRPTPLEVAGIAVSLTGVLFVISRGNPMALLLLQFNPWDLLLLVGMGVWAFYTIKLRERPMGLSLLGFVFAAALPGVLISLPFAGVELAVRGMPNAGWREAWGILYIGALPTLAAMLLFGFGVDRAGPVAAGVFTHLVAVFGSSLAALVIDERLHAYHAVGFLLVAGGALVSCLRPAPLLPSPPATSPPAPKGRP